MQYPKPDPEGPLALMPTETIDDDQAKPPADGFEKLITVMKALATPEGALQKSGRVDLGILADRRGAGEIDPFANTDLVLGGILLSPFQLRYGEVGGRIAVLETLVVDAATATYDSGPLSGDSGWSSAGCAGRTAYGSV
jgi:hypothetical protein